MAVYREREIPGFNAGAWPGEGGRTHLISREKEAGPLIHLVLDQDLQIVSKVSLPNGTYPLEDLRALRANGEVVAGVTVVKKKNDAYPGVVIFPASGPGPDFGQEIETIEAWGPGKNTTPVDDKTMIIRPDEIPGTDEENKYLLLVIQRHASGWREVGRLDFSGCYPTWAEDKIGTTIPPNGPTGFKNNKALVLIHGYKREKGVCDYAIGLAVVSRDPWGVRAVHHEPLIVPEEGQEELHPELRRVVYLCGAVPRTTPEGEVLILFVNRGDIQTRVKAFPLEDLKRQVDIRQRNL